MWLSILYAAADDPSTVLPIVGAGGAGLSAVLFYLLLDSNKERRALQKSYDELLMRMLPALTATTSMQERVLDVLNKVLEAFGRQISDVRQSNPEVLRRAYDELERLLDESGMPPPSRRRRRDK